MRTRTQIAKRDQCTRKLSPSGLLARPTVSSHINDGASLTNEPLSNPVYYPKAKLVVHHDFGFAVKQCDATPQRRGPFAPK